MIWTLYSLSRNHSFLELISRLQKEYLSRSQCVHGRRLEQHNTCLSVTNTIVRSTRVSSTRCLSVDKFDTDRILITYELTLLHTYLSYYYYSTRSTHHHTHHHLLLLLFSLSSAPCTTPHFLILQSAGLLQPWGKKQEDAYASSKLADQKGGCHRTPSRI